MEAHLRYKKQLNSGFGFQDSYKPKKIPKAKANQKIEEKNENEPILEDTQEKKKQYRVDFVQRNIEDASYQKSRVPKPKQITRKEQIVDSVHEPGKIPNYIYEHKEKERMKHVKTPEMVCPKGKRLLTDEEKLEAIESLNAQKEEIEYQLSHAPLKIESPALLRNKKIMEDQLIEIEKSIESLNRRYVFVPI